MLRNTINKAILLVTDENENNGLLFPAKSELDYIISDILNSSKNISSDLNYIQYEDEDEDYISFSKKSMAEENKRQKLKMSIKSLEDYMTQIPYDEMTDQQKLKINELKMKIDKIKKTLFSPYEKTQIDEENKILYAKLKTDVEKAIENEVRAEIMSLMKEQSRAIQSQLDSQLSDTDMKLASVFQEINKIKDVLVKSNTDDNQDNQDYQDYQDNQKDTELKEADEKIMELEKQLINILQQIEMSKNKPEATSTLAIDATQAAAEEVLQPTEEVLQPTEEVLQPTEEVLQPTEEVLQPTEKVLQAPEKFSNNIEKFSDSFMESSTLTWVLIIILILLILFILNRHFNIIKI